MSVFLFLKQIVDVLYPYHWLDYMMVIMVGVALIYQILLVRPNVKKSITTSDILIVLMVILLSVSFLKDIDAYGVYVKVLSAFLMYFVGRIYYERIKECTGALVTSAYLIVYMNFFYRLYQVGMSGIFKVTNAGGDLYYYDTDMAFAMILAISFIGMYGRNILGKYITIFLVCPYMVSFSDAGIQKILLVVILFLMFLYMLEKVTGKKRITNSLILICILGLLCLIVALILPVFMGENDINLGGFANGSILNKKNMYARYEQWQGILTGLEGADLVTKLFGINLLIQAGSLYLKTLYSLGIMGILLLVAFIVSVIYYVVQIEDRKTFYVMVLLTVMLLGTGATVDSMEATQMSWFPMMFAGMVISSVQNGRKA